MALWGPQVKGTERLGAGNTEKESRVWKTKLLTFGSYKTHHSRTHSCVLHRKTLTHQCEDSFAPWMRTDTLDLHHNQTCQRMHLEQLPQLGKSFSTQDTQDPRLLMQIAWNQLMSFIKVALYMDRSVLRQMPTFALENLPVQHRAGPWPGGLNLRKWTFILNL